MPAAFDPARAKTYFSSNFLTNHLFIGAEGQKKRAEIVFQRRDVNVSTVVCLTAAELIQLAGEIHRRQPEFASRPQEHFTTERPYDCWTRGGPRSRDRQRATLHHHRFCYAVEIDTDQVYVMCHYDGPA